MLYNDYLYKSHIGKINMKRESRREFLFSSLLMNKINNYL